jgi:hypothetical protein
VELCGRDNLRKLFHVSWLNINDIETLILDIEMPEVYSKVVTADERLSVTIHGYAVDMVSMGIGVRSARYCSNDSIMMCESW